MTRNNCCPLKINFGNIVFKEINCPKFVHFLDDNLPLIDKANKQSQRVLNLENCWSLEDFWFKLIIAMTAMSVLDMHWWYWYKSLTDAATSCAGLILKSIGEPDTTFTCANSVT
jgi:hypothetical protein